MDILKVVNKMRHKKNIANALYLIGRMNIKYKCTYLYNNNNNKKIIKYSKQLLQKIINVL